MPVLRIGLIGCGVIVRGIYLNILLRLPDVTLVALAEPDAERRREAARRAPAAVPVAEYQDLLKMPDVVA